MNARINSFEVFKNVALELYNRIDKVAPVKTFNEIIAFIVNVTLACELGFKAILAEENHIIYKNHDLKKLFNELDTTVKGFIKENMPSLKKDKSTVDNFDCILEIVSNNFKEWRYYYEKDVETNWLFLYELVCALDMYFTGTNYLVYLETLMKANGLR